MIKVLIVEDSEVKSQYLEYILSSDKDIEVIGRVSNGKQALDFIKKKKPDIITMDIEMPIMNGIEATKRIMAETPIPIIIVTARKEIYSIKTSMDALAFGAISVVDQPYGLGNSNECEAKKKLISLVKLMSKVKVVTRKHNIEKKGLKLENSEEPAIYDRTILPSVNDFGGKRIVAIGISSGGPQILAKILSGITGDFPYPILIVQHIADGFLENMVDWLKNLSKIPMNIGSDNELVRAGHVYFAPDNYQMGISLGRIKLFKNEDGNKICPSVDFLFSSLAKHYENNVIALILTGMGKDGTIGIKALKAKGSITIAQDKESSIVFGMPAEAIKTGSIDYIQSTDQISKILLNIEKSVKKDNNSI